MVLMDPSAILSDLSWYYMVFLVLTFISGSLVLRFLYNVYLHPLSIIPGPKLWAGSPFFYSQSTLSGQYAQQLKDFHLQYGPVVRVAPDELSFTDSHAWTVIYAYNNGTSFPKSPRWFRARPNGAFGILASPNTEHPRFRRTFAPAFTEKALLEKEELIAQHAGALVQKLKRTSSAGEAINMTDELEFTSFDIAGEFAFSEPFECLEKSDNRVLIRIVQNAMKLFTQRTMRHVMGVESLYNLIGNSLMSMKPRKTVYHKSLSDWTRARLDGGKKPGKEDLTEIVAKSTLKRNALSPAEAENALGDFMIASTETVASTTVSALYYLLRAPDIMAELQSEVCSAFVDANAINHKKLEELMLLNAVIDESMRLSPSIPAVLARVVPSPGAKICGHFIPGGTFVSFSQYAAYRSPSNFSDPDKFLPQRWINPDSFERHNADAFHPFSIGPRSCIGKIWGMMAVRALLANILLHFKLSRVGPDWKWEEQDSWFIWSKKDLMIHLEKLKE